MASINDYIRTKRERSMDERRIEQDIELLKERINKLQSIVDYNTMMETIVDPEEE